MKPELAEYPESRLLNLLKAFSWPIAVAATTARITRIIKGEIDVAVIGSIELLFKLFIYCGRERIWQLFPQDAIRQNARMEAKW